jgi:peptidoglycan/xylan/chitin deacetylase (PgdA/CDA1 family)
VRELTIMGAFLTILTFHTIDGQSSATSFSPQVFQRSMAKLSEKGYRTLSLVQVANCLRRGVPFPDHSLVITFDDGYQSVYDEAFPVLQRYGMSATVFLTVGRKGLRHPTDRLPSLHGRSMLAWREIREMQRWGIDFGAHTLTHPDLSRLSTEQIETEIRESKAIIEEALATPVTCFAYPYGRYEARSHEIARRHFVAACSDSLGLVTATSDPHALERVDAYYLRTDALFDLMLSGLFPWYIGGRSLPRLIRRAIQQRVR